MIVGAHVMLRSTKECKYKTRKDMICEWCESGEEPDASLFAMFKELEQRSDVIVCTRGAI